MASGNSPKRRSTINLLFWLLAIIHLAGGAAYWPRQLFLDFNRHGLSSDEQRRRMFAPYAAIADAVKDIPTEAVVMLENASLEQEHFSIYFLYPRRVKTRPTSEATHILRFENGTAFVLEQAPSTTP
jgi:hypothetical protein